jgi:hypothetical protein
MFVRWEVRQRRRSRSLGPLLIATLVESKRVNGKPRHRVVAYLGAIRVNCIDDPISTLHRARFWEAKDVLDELDLSADERVRIEAILESRVPRREQEIERALDRARNW